MKIDLQEKELLHNKAMNYEHKPRVKKLIRSLKSLSADYEEKLEKIITLQAVQLLRSEEGGGGKKD